MEPSGFENVTAIVLAGGKSQRMKGIDKCMLPVQGVPMIEHIVRQLEPYFSEIIIGANDTGRYKFLGHRVVPDVRQGRGPLMGIYSCLSASGNDLNFVTACDTPDINISFIRRMLELTGDADVIMPVSGDDHYEPLHAIYRKSVIPAAECLLTEGKFKTSGLIGKVKTRLICFDGNEWHHNINRDEDYRNYEGGLR
jgi:molybdopterin-guanine dinucleotide biosynthesis protein A